MRCKKFVSWRRVSTFKQSRSGLGLEAQKEIIRYFVEREHGEIIADYSECYTGTELSGCIELRKAIEYAKQENAILVIAKTDRFRNTVEALKVYEEMGDGNIMFCDLPHTDKFTLTLFFALAEREALIVSIRTKQALAAKKARGESLGGATRKWHDARNAKTQQQLWDEAQRAGRVQNSHHIIGRDFAMWVKVFQKAFPDSCCGDVMKWTSDTWRSITTKGDAKYRIISIMRDMRDLDPTGEAFKNWDFHADVTSLQKRIGCAKANLLTSVQRYKKHNNKNERTT